MSSLVWWFPIYFSQISSVFGKHETIQYVFFVLFLFSREDMFFSISILFLVNPPVPQPLAQSMTTTMSISKLMRRSVRRPGRRNPETARNPSQSPNFFAAESARDPCPMLSRKGGLMCPVICGDYKGVSPEWGNAQSLMMFNGYHDWISMVFCQYRVALDV